MTDDLVQRLRTCSAGERRAVAMELAQTRNDEAVDKLIKIVNGGDYTPPVYGRKHNYSLFKSKLGEERWQNGLADQLLAIEALGCTRSEKAFNFLLELYETKREYKEIARECTYPMHGSGDLPSSESVDKISFSFPNSKGELARELTYTDTPTAWGVEGYTINITNKLSTKKEEVHKTIQMAVSQLYTSLGQPRLTGNTLLQYREIISY